jgi:hypothetical protein
MGKSKTKKNSKRSKHAKNRRGRRQSRKRRAGSRGAATNGCSGVSSGVRVGQKRIDLSNWSPYPYNPGTGIYRGEVDCGDKEPNGRGRASGNGTWESDNIVHNDANEWYTGKSNISGTIIAGTIISGKWKNNLPYDVTVKNNMGTYNYKKESYDLIEANVRSSMGSDEGRVSMDTRSSMGSDEGRLSMDTRSSMGSDEGRFSMDTGDRSSVSSRNPMLNILRENETNPEITWDRPNVTGSRYAKKKTSGTNGGRRSNKRKTRRRNHKH